MTKSMLVRGLVLAAGLSLLSACGSVSSVSSTPANGHQTTTQCGNMPQQPECGK